MKLVAHMLQRGKTKRTGESPLKSTVYTTTHIITVKNKVPHNITKLQGRVNGKSVRKGIQFFHYTKITSLSSLHVL